MSLSQPIIFIDASVIKGGSYSSGDMQKLFKYWHVIHMPFAIIMLIVVVIHVAVTLAFGYKWIF